ncbi:MAG: ankyrin repeat domain-containing protein [Alphaproteobacteria bacterium]
MALESDTRDALRAKIKKNAAKSMAPKTHTPQQPQPAPVLTPGTPLWDLYVAADDRNLQGIKDSFAKHPELKTPMNLNIVLINGVQGDRNDIVDYALSQKADVNRADGGGMTALQMAVKHGNADMFLKLLKAGGNPKEKNFDGKTLRQQAMKSDIAGCAKIVEILDDKKLMASLGHGPKPVKRAPR